MVRDHCLTAVRRTDRERIRRLARTTGKRMYAVVADALDVYERHIRELAQTAEGAVGAAILLVDVDDIPIHIHADYIWRGGGWKLHRWRVDEKDQQLVTPLALARSRHVIRRLCEACDYIRPVPRGAAPGPEEDIGDGTFSGPF